jgi:hypothetical protein
MTTAMWFTGRRRTVRALVYGASAILTMACAAGLVLGHVELAWRVAGAEPTQRLLTHGGAVGLVGLAVVAGLTVYGWHAELSGALAASGTSILALTTVAHVWLGVHASALDAARDPERGGHPGAGRGAGRAGRERRAARRRRASGPRRRRGVADRGAGLTQGGGPPG